MYTPEEDFQKYVRACSDAGSDRNYFSGDDHYSAENASGYLLDPEYIGFDQMTISITLPDNEESRADRRDGGTQNTAGSQKE